MKLLPTFKSALVALAAVAAIATQSAEASSTYTYNFDRVTSNSSTDLGEQLSMVVSEAQGGALFTFYNDVGVQSSITDIYFDDASPGLFTNIAYANDSGMGVSFDSKAAPSNLPGGNTIAFVANYSGDSNKPNIPNNGVNSSTEWVSFLGTFASNTTFDGLINALGSRNFRVGLHIQAIAASCSTGSSDSYVNNPSPVPLPAAAWLFGSALIGFITLSNRRKV